MSAPGDATGILLLLGAGIAAGYLGHWLFRRYHVSDILPILLVGFVLGPLTGILDVAAFRPALGILGPLALSIVLFQAGLDLELKELRRAWAPALGFTLLTWSASAAGVTLVAYHLLGLDLILATLFGVAVAATGIMGVVPLLERIGAPPRVRILLTLETSLGELLSAIGTASLAAMVLYQESAWSGGANLLSQLTIGAAVGILAGFAWARALHALDGDRHAFPLTLATLAVSYAAATALGGSGFVAALAIGIIVGNARLLTRIGELPDMAPTPAFAKLQQSEAIFILRSTFLLYLGAAIPLAALTPRAALGGLALLGVLVAGRLLATRLSLGPARSMPHSERILVGLTMPRGLATATIASIPLAMGVPGAEGFVFLTVLVIIGADLATTLGLQLHARELKKKAAIASARPEALAGGG